jgi:hypothetical protein
MVVHLKTIWKNGVVPTRKSIALPVVHKSNNNETKKNDELKIPFDQWIMPPQPVGYIKFHGFDFF